jgi:hypothetical protein
LVTKQQLQSETTKALGQMAKSKGVSGWSSMRKDELIKRLLQVARQAEMRAAAGSVGGKSLPTRDATAEKGRKSPLTSKASGPPKAIPAAKKTTGGMSSGAAPKSSHGTSDKTTRGDRPGASRAAVGQVPTQSKAEATAKPGKSARVSATAKVPPTRASETKNAGETKGVTVSKSVTVAKSVPSQSVTAGKKASRAGGGEVAAAREKTRRPEAGVKATTKAISQPKSVSVTPASVKSASVKSASVKSASVKSASVKSASVKSASERTSSTDPDVVGRLKTLQERKAAAKDLAFFRQQLSTSEEPKKDRIVLFVRDPYWLQAYWEITKLGVERARAAMAEHWHMAEPVLRVMTTEDEGVTGSTEQVSREIKIHGGVNNWYIDVKDPPHSFRVVIGYLAPGKKFHAIAQSNLVRTPVPGSSDHVDHNWTDLADIGDRVFSMSGGFEEGVSTTLREIFEEKLSRPMSRSALSRYGTDELPGKLSSEHFVVDAELLIFGQTHRSAEVTISGEPVKLRDDGSFTVRMGLPDKRQVFPVSSTSFDGTYTYTTVLAIERNTKVMEPMSMEPGEDF